VDRIGRVEKRGRKEGDGLLDGLGENRRHGEWDVFEGVCGVWGCVGVAGLLVALTKKSGKDGRAAN